MTDLHKAYRQSSLDGSLPDIFIQAYDRIALLLHSAAASIESRDIEKKTAELNRALEIVFHLQGALNFEQGGEVAQTLSSFYSLIWREIMKGSARLDAGTLRQAAAHVAEVRKVWEQSLAIIPEAEPGPEMHPLKNETPKALNPRHPLPLQEYPAPAASWTA